MIRLLTENDFDDYSKLRSYGLISEPTSFWATEEEESPYRHDRFQQTLKNPFNFMIGAFVDGKLASIAGYHRFDKLKLNHKGYIWGVYTHPDFRGKGLAKGLMIDLMAKAFSVTALNQITLTTRADNEPAIRLYKNLGFKVYGTEPQSSQINGNFYDEVEMVRFRDR